MEELTLDTGALVAMERRKARGLFLLRSAKTRASRLLVPVPVVTEWWRGRTDVREDILEAVTVVPLTLGVAQTAGEALGHTKRRGRSPVDAMVMALAARRGGIVYTSDVDDLEALRDAYFPSVRVLGI